MKLPESIVLTEVPLTDPSRRITNQIPKNWVITAKPGIYPETCTIVPTQVLGDTATILLTGRQALEFLSFLPIAVPSEVNESSKELPLTGQRKPTPSRTKGILAGIRDDCRTPRRHTATVQCFAFGVSCDKNGICFDKDSLACFTDGAGRASAWILDFNEIQATEGGDLNEHVLVANEHVVQLNIDLSGDRKKCLQEFLLHNRDAKRTTRGTVQAVENTLLGHHEGKIDLDNVLWSTAVTQRLYKQSQIAGTLLELFPWKMEGHQSTNSLFRGKGCSQSVSTALRSMEGEIRRSKLSVPKIATALDFALTALYKSCPTSLNDAHDALEKRGYKCRYRLHSTLAMKMFILLAIKLYPVCGDDPKRFAELVDEVMDAIYRDAKGLLFKPTKIKKMTLDKFFEESIFFNTGLFNSGAANTRTLIPALERGCDRVLEQIAEDAA
jgi:hypothetical protein